MKLKQIASNMTELHLNDGTVVLFSYDTPVAAISDNLEFGNVLKTNTTYSRTTTKHINRWLNDKFGMADKSDIVNEVDQSVLDELIK